MAGPPHKILLFYVFLPLPDPTAIALWQRELCERLGLRGRIISAPQGLNGTVGGDIESLLSYIKATKSYPGMRGIDFKWSEGHRDHFPRLSVKVRSEVVAFGIPEEIKVTPEGVVGGGTHLKPKELHELFESRPDEVVFFDGRNAFESKIGRFKNAIVPNTNTTHDFIQEIESGKYDHLKDSPIVTYCTGGIRCEILTAAMKNRGFTDVYQLDGGIVRYGEEYGNHGLWEGSLYVFDKRMTVDFEKDTPPIGQCEYCEAPTNNFYNCNDLVCRTLTLMCDTCHDSINSETCLHGDGISNNRDVLLGS
ncbi:MAG: rhodanese-related sulfurtransferase [Candidatus Nanopelagicales bacterium]|nr:rhodanese-related sulfurtransferase [Candidatus Nanopelagicales bacterium]MCF8551638.1 rhodanese-related sulfurtransferase [Candidatus Nanopelagicales bacterium]